MSRKIISGQGSGYSASEDMLNAEYQIAVVLYIVGLDGESQDLYELEDVIAAIHSSFYYYQPDENRFVPAHGFFFKKNSNMLKTVYRRARTLKKLTEGAVSDV